MNGLAIIEKTDTETKGFFIDQDTIECARLNAKTKKRVEKSEAVRRIAEMKFRKAEKEKARRKAYNLNTIKHILIHCGINASPYNLPSCFPVLPVCGLSAVGGVVRKGGKEMNIPDNYDLWEAYDREQEKRIAQLPNCAYCTDPIQADFYYEINGANICEHCLDQFFRKEVCQ